MTSYQSNTFCLAHISLKKVKKKSPEGKPFRKWNDYQTSKQVKIKFTHWYQREDGNNDTNFIQGTLW